MAKINFFGDFKADSIKHLNMSAELVYLLNMRIRSWRSDSKIKN